VDLNGRDRGDPWSLRQCGVYQQICLKTRRSTWILLQVSRRMRAKLDQALRSRAYKNDKLGIDPVVLHIIFISAMAANWQDYLEYLHSQLAILVRRGESFIPRSILTFFSRRMKRHVSQGSTTTLTMTSLSISRITKTCSYFGKSSLEHRRSLTHVYKLLRGARFIAASWSL
jgi:hypothetical protein